MLMSVPLIHVIPMLTVTTLLEVSLACADQVSVEMEWLAQVRSFNLQNIDFVSILLWFITCYLILDSKILMSVPLIHVIPMLTVPTLLEVSLARVSQVSVEMEWLAQVRSFNSQKYIDFASIVLWNFIFILRCWWVCHWSMWSQCWLCQHCWKFHLHMSNGFCGNRNSLHR